MNGIAKLQPTADQHGSFFVIALASVRNSHASVALFTFDPTDGTPWRVAGRFEQKMRAIARSGSSNTVVVVGEGGAIEVSDNGGLSWQAVESGTGNNLSAITYCSRWIAAGDGVILTSEDARTWTQVELDVGASGGFTGIACGSQQTVVVSNAGEVFSDR